MMLRVKLDTIAAAGFARRARVELVLAHVLHVGGSLYDVDLGAVMALGPAEEASTWSLPEYAAAIAEAAKKIQRSPLPVKPGLGDYVAAGLSAIGVTKERVSAVVGSCGCSERQAALNEWGARTLGIGRVDPPT